MANHQNWQDIMDNLAKNKTKLKVYRGKQNAINHLEPEDGAIYFAIDTKKIFLGAKVTNALGTSIERILMSSTDGGNGSFGFVYSAASLNDGTLIKVNPDVDNIDNPGYYIKQSAFGFTLEPERDPNNSELFIYKPHYTEEALLPDENALVFNSDGWIFRVIKQLETEEKVLVNLLSTGSASGGGSGGGSGAAAEDLYLTVDEKWGSGLTYILGQDYELSFTGKADRDRQVKFYIYVKDEANDIVLSDGTEAISWDNDTPYIFHTNNLPETSNLTVKISIDSNNSRMLNAYKPYAEFKNIKIVKMELQKVNDNEYYAIKTADKIDQTIPIQYIPVGNDSLVTTLHVSIDGTEYPELNKVLKKEGVSNPYNQSNTLIIPKQNHGSHTITLQSSVSINGLEKYSNSLNYELAWTEENNNIPVIWVGNYDPVVINYENSYIKYMVYDPLVGETIPANVSLYKNGQLISEVAVDYASSMSTGWAEWDISNAYDVGSNVFSIVCRGAKKDVEIYVTNEGARDLSLKQPNSLLINYTSAGRSNLEIKSKRKIWSDTTGHTDSATLTGFNWQSNGWKKDGVIGNAIDNGTYLSLTNGASISIPCSAVTLNNATDYTIEARFRIRNVQQYSTLVQSLPLYFYEVDSYQAVGENDEFDNSQTYYIKRNDQDIYDKVIISEFEEGIDYYTRTPGPKSETAQPMSWIQKNNKVLIYDDYGSPLMDENNIQKTYQTKDGVVCKWLEDEENKPYGLVLGSQEAYFRTSRGSVNVRYKEDEVINISVVVSKTDKLVYIYLNGILSGADALPEAGTGKIVINSPFVFNSDYCDIDLYRFRVYQCGLTMPEVIHNYLSDIHSVTLFDQNQLTTVYNPTQVSYQLLLEYNQNHPGEQTMPYAVWKIKDPARNEKLPYYKGDKCKVDISFVNPCADEALKNHDITPWEYYTHCPSFEATDVDIDVQGTSSQGYPRRNYKTKYKEATSWTFTSGPLAGYSMTKEYYFYKNSGELVLNASGEPASEGFDLNTMQKLTKNFHMDNNVVGTNKFTWKIDYMESSGSYNTGFANLLGNLQYPLYTKHPLDDLGLSGVGMRTTVYGFPILTFHQYETTTNNQTSPGQVYEYIGRYNMNLDKGSNEYYGFESTAEQPYIILPDGTHPQIKKIAECWELSDNQGTWTSFKYPNAAAREAGFGTAQPDNADRLEVMRHFEYRYSAYDKELDAIGADGKYDGKMKDDLAKKIAENDEITAANITDAQKSAFVRKRYANLEALFNWLDSTNREEATNEAILDPQTREVINSVDYYTANDYSSTLGATSVANQSGGYITTFTKDTSEFRLEKFRNEFPKHLDKEYCLIYFILTELLLCYDSRGKNMMLASFGPQEINGDYIWYPIFYDIDTQLGLNNSGAYLWDYDADVTLDGLFSTPSSVLWVNFFSAFEEDIKNKYRVLRGASDGSNVVGNLSYDKIAGAYECNPEVFGSYAMRGIRPIVAIGLDEYYKYFATTKTGYFDTSGQTIIEGSPEYAYACQGDKKLTTELLVRNRLNYVDSWWLGGNYDITQFKQGQFWGRMNGNRITKTSDTYLDVDQATYDSIIAENPNYEGVLQRGTYPVAYYDAQPGFKLKPFLKQYVTYFTDEVPGPSVKYNATAEQKENGIQTITNQDVIETYKATKEMPNEQLVYLPGVDYLSSLGDLSTSYFSEFTLTAGKRLLDLNLGSDIPGYKNELIDANKKFNLADEKDSTTKKSLLKKIVMTGMTTFDRTLDVSGSEKLQEFRALRTSLPNVYFADGAPLHTVHLPASLETLKLIENNELTNIITTTAKAQVFNRFDDEGKAIFNDPSEYRGLYIEGATDYVSGSTGHSLNQLIIEGGSLGYGSYTLLNNLVNAKKNALTKNKLSVSLKDVYWCPYEQVQYGENRINNVNYYFLTDHNTFIPYNDLSEENWSFNTLNGLIYTYNNNVDKTIIEDTTLLDNFITWYNNSNNQFTNTSDATYSVPTITGTVFIANENGEAIDEEKLTSYYGQYYPNLTIYAENVNTKNVTKYVNILDSGKIDIIDVKRSSGDIPLMLTAECPTKTNYDFKGWEDENGNLIIAYDGENYINAEESLSQLSFEDLNTNVITLYARFEDHAYKMRFYNKDGSLIETVDYIYSNINGISSPSIIPAYTDNSLELTEVYKWLGWARGSDPNAIDVVNISTLHPTNDLNFIAVYEKTSVYNNVLDSQYLLTTEVDGGLAIGLNPNYYLTGKITLPSKINDINVVQLGSASGLNFNNSGSKKNAITHIFFEGNNNITTIYNQCFMSDIDLVYFEPLAKCVQIGSGAFQDCKELSLDCLYDIISYADIIGTNAFYRVGRDSVSVPGKAFTRLDNNAFSGWGYATSLTLGSGDQPTELIHLVETTQTGVLNTNSAIFSGFGSMRNIESIQIYINSIYNTDNYKDNLLMALGLSNNINLITWHIIEQ